MMSHQLSIVVIAEPSIRVIRSRIDRGYVMLRGRIVAEGQSAADLEREYLQHMGMARSADGLNRKG